MEKQKCPEIRFNQFNENWSIISLGDLMNVGSVKRVHQADWCDTGVRFLRARDIVAFAKNEDIADPIYISQDRYEEYSKLSGKVRVGDLLVTGVGTIGVPMLVGNDDPLYFKDGNVIWFKNENAINGLFLYYSFTNKTIQNFIKDSAGIGTVGTYTITSGKRTPIYLPKENEQIQIGNFFQNLDQSITLHEKKFTQTQNLKKAMLEKMFPKAGNTQPEIRLKGFSGDWVNSQLSNFISIKHGFAFDGAYFSEIETNLCLLTPGNFMIGGGFKAEKFIYYNGEVPENYILQENDLLVTMTDLSKESDTLGLPALLPLIRGKTLLHNQRLGLISFDNDELEKGFLFYLLQTESYHKYIVLSATGTTVKHTSPNKILAFVCDVPEFEEQKAIGQFFKQLDKTLVLQQQQLQTLKNLKQAFLEKMFV